MKNSRQAFNTGSHSHTAREAGRQGLPFVGRDFTLSATQPTWSTRTPAWLHTCGEAMDVVEGGQATEAESPAMGCSSHPLSGQEPPVLPPCPHDLY